MTTPEKKIVEMSDAEVMALEDHPAFGDGIKAPHPDEQEERDWRAGPDGLRPTLYMRVRLANIEESMTNPEYAKVSAIIDRIEQARARNNRHWVEIIRLVMRVAPVEARAIFDEIERTDQEILDYSKSLRSPPAPAESERAPSAR